MKKILYKLALISTCLMGCQGTADPAEDTGKDDTTPGNKVEELQGTITLYADHDIIMADNTYTSALTVLLMDNKGVEHDVTADVEIYCNNSEKPIDDTDFRTSEEGVYEFYAMRGFDISNSVTVKAVKGIPALPEDTDSESLDFRHRMMLLQHTGNECPNCPKLMETLRLLASDEEYNALYYHVASHSYNTSDAAYSSAAASLSKEMGVRYYPWLTFDLTRDNGYDLSEIKAGVDARHKDVADAGISASVAHVDGSVYANIGIKAGTDARYRITAWLLEDNIRSTQSGATAAWQHSHDNCLRAMAGSNKTECIYGRNIGYMEAGSSQDLILSVDLENDWKVENCKMMFIVTSGEGDYELVNCAVCPVGDSVAYEYN